MKSYSPTPPPLACSLCEAPIWDGEEFYRIDGNAICAECLPRFAEDYFADRALVRGEESQTEEGAD